MFKSLFRLLVCSTTILVLISCNPANNRPLTVSFSADNSSLVFKRVDPAGLLQLRNEQPADSVWNTLVRVLEKDLAEDTEQPFKGRFSLTDSSLVFTPERAFVSGRNYLVISYLNARFASAESLLKGKMNHQLQPEAYLLTCK